MYLSIIIYIKVVIKKKLYLIFIRFIIFIFANELINFKDLIEIIAFSDDDKYSIIKLITL